MAGRKERHRERNMGKRAQHEIIGFVLIVVLVVIVSLVFLAISLRQPSTAVTSESKQVAGLLSSMLQYTTDCAIYMPQYESLRDLIKSCYHSEQCIDGTPTCQKLQDVLSGLLDAAQPDVSGEQAVKGYEFNASYAAEQQGFYVTRAEQGSLAYVSKGTCKGNSIGSQEFLPIDAGTIRISLKFCY